MSDKHRSPFLIELQIDEAGEAKPFDVLAPGDFRDMWGRDFSIKPETLEKIAANTEKLIESSTTESGELVGIPVDAYGHSHEDAAGWIKKVYVENGRLRAVPEWTDLGADLIQSKRQRMFSGSFDLFTEDPTMFGGTLTNYPAVREQAGGYLLRPIELESPAQDEIFLLSTPLASPGMAELVESIKSLFKPGENPGANGGKKPMTVKLEDLTPEQKDSLLAELQAENPGAPIPKEWVELAGKFDTIEDYFQSRLSSELQAQGEKHRVAEFSRKLVEGGEDLKVGIPGDAQEIEKLLLELEKPARDKVINLLGNIQKNGLVDFSEVGDGGEKDPGESKMALPPLVAADLQAHVAEGGKIEDYFEAAGAVLGEMAQYDLSAFMKEED